MGSSLGRAAWQRESLYGLPALVVIAGQVVSLWVSSPLPRWLALGLGGALAVALVVVRLWGTHHLYAFQRVRPELLCLLLISWAWHDPRLPFSELPPQPEGVVYWVVEVESGGKAVGKRYRYTVRSQGYYADSVWREWQTGLTLSFPLVDTGYAQYAPGDRLLVQARAWPHELGGGAFAYSTYARMHGIGGSMYAGAHQAFPLGRGKERWDVALAKERLARVSRFRASGVQEAWLGPVVAMTLGDRLELGKEETQWFRESGLSHILAISGFHVGIVYGASFLLMRFLSGSNVWILALRHLLPLLGVWGFSLFCGLGPPVARASIMLTLYGGIKLVQHRLSGLTVYLLSAALVCLLEPTALVDLGFYLSFLAVAGIVIFLPYFSALWPVKVWGLRGLWQLFLLSLAAQLGTSVLVLAAFGTVPVIGLLTSIPASLLAFPIVILGLLVLLLPEGSWLSLGLGYPLNLSSMLLVRVSELGSHFRVGSVELPSAALLLFGASVGLFAMRVLWPRRGWGELALMALFGGVMVVSWCAK